MKTTTKIVISAITIFIITIVVVLFYRSKINSNSILQNSSSTNVQKEDASQAVQEKEPKKTDFGTNLPTDFIKEIPIEDGAKVQQSYGLDYETQKQLSIVFLSSKTVKENYVIYSDFFKKQNWNISNKYESDKLSSLYITKENNNINVTITENTLNSSVKSQVSISILKK
jgi:hypothetical protein